MNQEMSGGVGEYLRNMHDPSVEAGDDALDPETIARIEDLHSATLEEDAHRRFGSRKGSRSRELGEARLAEQEFLNEHGFATYNDYRLRIRRSTVVTQEAREVVDPTGASPEAAPVTGAPCLPETPPAEALDAGNILPGPAVPKEDAAEGAREEAAASPWVAQSWATALRAEFDRVLAVRVRMADQGAGDAGDSA
jgi:hypothetical protein